MNVFFKTLQGAVTGYGSIADIGAALQRNETPLRPDGSPYDVRGFMGGILFDGYPLNVILDGVWYPGQQEALQGAGFSLPAAAVALPVIAQPTPGQGNDLMKYLPYAAAGLALYFILKKR